MYIVFNFQNPLKMICKNFTRSEIFFYPSDNFWVKNGHRVINALPQGGAW